MVRRLTPVECERLQGFPDNWTKQGIQQTPSGYTCMRCSGKNIETHGLYCEHNVVEMSDTQRYKCLGNAVTVNVVYEVARRLA
jgi:DNA (cytosine-5)-methyltransferase 1